MKNRVVGSTIQFVVCDSLFQSWTQPRLWWEAGRLWLRDSCSPDRSRSSGVTVRNQVVRARPGAWGASEGAADVVRGWKCPAPPATSRKRALGASLCSHIVRAAARPSLSI